MDKHFIKTYETEEEALRQIEKLKDEGYSESDMYIMTQEDDQLSMIRGDTNVDSYAEEGNWLNNFTSFLTGNKQIDLAFRNMELPEEDRGKYVDELKDGRLLLYVNKDYEARFAEVGGDSFKLGEKEKTELQNRQKDSETPVPYNAEEESMVKLDDHLYEDKKSTK